MIPEKDDPRWRDLVTSKNEVSLSALAAQMVVSRARRLTAQDLSNGKVNEAISLVYDFFKKNEYAVKEDIIKIFGTGE